MIITRSPLRISLGGGGTDLPSYYERHGGFLVAAAIDKYIYTTLHQTFVPDLIVKYSKLERVASAKQIEHPIIREAFDLVGVEGPYLEMTSMADIPAGTGLGSSGSFTTSLLKALHSYKKNLVHPADGFAQAVQLDVAGLADIPAGTGLGSSGSFTTSLLKALHSYKKNLVHPAELAAQACYIELNRLREPIGKQDQYIAAYGGITCFEFQRDGNVKAWPLKLSEETLYNLEDNLLLFFTGYSRSASSILKEQHDKSKQDDQAMLENLHFIKDLGRQSAAAMEKGDLREFARLMDVHWQRKKERSGNMSNGQIDQWYETARANGALGGKIIGAGGGGFLMFYADEDKAKLRHAMRQAGLTEVRFRFDFQGTKVLEG